MKHIPNILSAFRILLIPVIIWVYLGATEFSDYLLTGVLLGVSGITDMADGYIARKYNFITDLGKVLDPIADKLTQIAMAVAVWMRHSSLWPLPVFLVVKEVLTAAGGLWIYRKAGVVSSAKWYGKFATIIYYAVMVLLMVFPSIFESGYAWAPLALIVLAMVFSAVRYAVDFGRDVKNRKSETEEPPV